VAQTGAGAEPPGPLKQGGSGDGGVDGGGEFGIFYA